MKKHFLHLLIIATILSSCGVSNTKITNLIQSHSTRKSNSIEYEVVNFIKPAWENPRVVVSVNEKELLAWFSKNPEYKYLGSKEIINTVIKKGVVKRFEYLRVSDIEKDRIEKENRIKKLEEEKITQLKKEEEKKIFTGQYDGDFKNMYVNPVLMDLFNQFKNLIQKNGQRVYYINNYKGEMVNGLPNGNGIYELKFGERWDNIYYKYSGNWKNGLFDGQGRLLKRYKTEFIAIYEGSWKDNLYHGKGTSYEIINDDTVEFIAYSGNFINGKKEGLFTVTGQYKDKISHGISFSGINWYEKFQFQLEIEYNNNIEISKRIIKDDANKMDLYFANIIAKRNEANQSYYQDKCTNCEIDKNKSEYPKEVDNYLWVGTSKRNGQIIMKNGDKYTFDYKDGKCRIINGIFETDDYYNNFKQMLDNLEIKCKEKYCK